MMHIIGLAGGIASGKSSVSRILSELGAAIIDADAIARTVVEPGKPAFRQILEHFGDAVLATDGNLNRRKLGDIVFSDPVQREQLENITHPAIWSEVTRQISDAEAAGLKVAVLDVPLLFETGWEKHVDSVWVVYVDRQTQIARLINRDYLTLGQAEQRIAAQFSLERKRQLANIVIDNSSDPENTRRQVVAAWQILSGRKHV
jgi:dephospho-CoA kinase